MFCLRPFSDLNKHLLWNSRSIYIYSRSRVPNSRTYLPIFHDVLMVKSKLNWSFIIISTTSNCPFFASHTKPSFLLGKVNRWCTGIRGCMNTGAVVAALIVQETVFVTSSNFLGVSHKFWPIESFQRGQFPLLHHAVGSCCAPPRTRVLRHLKQGMA